MKQTILRALPFAASLALPLVPPSAHADAAACQQIISAMARMAQTPSHQYMTQTMAGLAARKNEVVISGKSMWLLVDGHWKSIPYDAQNSIDKMKRKYASAGPSVTCARVRDEAASGEAATVYSMHEDNVDSQLWISASRGLPLRQVIDIAGLKSHMDSRIDYTNVQPPAGQ